MELIHGGEQATRPGQAQPGPADGNATHIEGLIRGYHRFRPGEWRLDKDDPTVTLATLCAPDEDDILEDVGLVGMTCPHITEQTGQTDYRIVLEAAEWFWGSDMSVAERGERAPSNDFLAYLAFLIRGSWRIVPPDPPRTRRRNGRYLHSITSRRVASPVTLASSGPSNGGDAS